MRRVQGNYKASNSQADFNSIVFHVCYGCSILTFIMSNSPYSLTKPPKAPKKARLEKPYSLRNLPRAPKKENGVRSYLLGQISRLILPPTPPPIMPLPPRKKARTAVDLTPIPLDWGMTVAEREAPFLADTRCVRLKFLFSSPKDIENETSIEFLEKLW